MTSVVVTFWAGAARAAGHRSEPAQASTLRALRDNLALRPELSAVMGAASLLVNGAQYDPDAALPEGATVDVLPPFAGG
ncbi:MAG: thiamine S protein [Pseudonocardiales bacterium]|nr:thiamine S protein [Pseudonocardiales bacterium]